MPNHGKGGRKRQGEQLKAKMVPLKVQPELRATLDRLTEEAKAAGKPSWSLTREVEERIIASFQFDRLASRPSHDGAIALLKEITAELIAAEDLTGKRWNRDLRTWAMVREAISNAIERNCPDAIDTDLGEDGPRAQLRHIEEKIARDAYALGIYRVNIHRGRDGTWPPRTNRAIVEEQIAQQPENMRGPLEDALEALMKHEADYARQWDCLRSLRRDFNAVIDEAVTDWRAEARKDGRLVPPEYRPGLVAQGYVPAANTAGLSVTLDDAVAGPVGVITGAVEVTEDDDVSG